jgi:hypothetical protein
MGATPAEPIEILEKFGFVKDETAGAMVFYRDDVDHDGISPRKIVNGKRLAVFGAGPAAPDGGDPSSFKMVITSSFEWIKDIVFETADVGDLITLAIADRNSDYTATGSLNDIPDADTFTFDDTCISNAFGDLQFGDWVLDRSPSEKEIHLANPILIYGSAYTDWRESLVSEICGLEQSAPAV